MNKAYRYVGGLKPSRSLFNNSHSKLFDMDFGELIPVLGMDMLPGQSTEISLETIIRMQPLVAPVLHEINAYTHFFFVPYRLLMDDKDHGFETFLTGGVSGEESVQLPQWEFIPSHGHAVKYDLSDYFDIPINVDFPLNQGPLGFNQRAYNFIYNEYYRDQNFMSEVSLSNNYIMRRCWEKDYFTSALPNQQRGIAPALPLSGFLPLQPQSSLSGSLLFGVANAENTEMDLSSIVDQSSGKNMQIFNSVDPVGQYLATSDFKEVAIDLSNVKFGSDVGVDVSEAVTFNVSDLRLAFQVQKFLERNMRAGARYTEFLQAHFGVSPSDSRLQRPEYVGGCKSHVIISEVLQSSATVSDSTPQGNMAGKGIVADVNEITRFTAPEFGVLVGIMSIMPRSMYSQGLDRKYSRYTRYDWAMPEFAHLSEQAILTKEIYATGDPAIDNKIFGYTGIFNEYRSSQSKVNGGMRDTLNYWHLAREFSSPPVLNWQFLECNAFSDGLRRIFAVQDERSFIVHLGFNIRNTVPLPEIAEPGLIDHF